MNSLLATITRIAVFLSTTAWLQAEVRTFTSTAGTTLKGELVSVVADTITIRKEDGQSLTLKRSAFSPADQIWLNTQAASTPPIRDTADSEKKAKDERLFRMEYGKPSTIEIVVCDSFDLSGSPNKVQFAAPLPPSTSRQRLVSVKVDKKFSRTNEKSDLNREVLVGTFEELEPHKLSQLNNVVITYRVELTPRKLVLLEAGQEPVQPIAEKTDLYLGSDATIDWKSRGFMKWIKSEELLRNPNESALSYGRRLHQHIVRIGTYKYEGGTNKASILAERSEGRIVGDCGDFSVLFTAACRANGIPCRMLSGRWAMNTNSRGGLNAGEVKTHVYIEFFDPLVGWIPDDISGAVQSGTEFGTDPRSRFVTMHFDSDLIIPFGAGQKVETQWLLLPHAFPKKNGHLTAGTTHLMQIEKRAP